MRSLRALLHAILLSSHIDCALGARRIKKHLQSRTKDAAGAFAQDAVPAVALAVPSAASSSSTAALWRGQGDTVEAPYEHVASIGAFAPEPGLGRERSTKSVNSALWKLKRKKTPGSVPQVSVPFQEDTSTPKRRLEPPEVIEVLRTLPHYKKHMSGSCFVLASSERLGCRGACKCLWHERCYPKYVLWRGEPQPGYERGAGQMNSSAESMSQEGEMMTIDVGTCAWSMQVMVLLSVGAFLVTIIAVVFLRMILLLIVDIKEHFSNPNRHDIKSLSSPVGPMPVVGPIRTSSYHAP